MNPITRIYYIYSSYIMESITIQNKIKELREEYKKTASPVERKLIEARGKLLLWALEKRQLSLVE